MIAIYKRCYLPGLILLLASGIGPTAVAAKSVVRNAKISLSRAQELGEIAAKSTDFPIVVNERVLTQLNRYVSTRGGRDSIRKALKRMKSYQPMLDAKSAEHNVPLELLALPIVESGYRNLSAAHNPKSKAAGLWQFIPGTARGFGLRVDQKVDERLDEHKATDAAMRYLAGLKLKFQDWHLALLGYNAGESRVQKGIESTGSRDAFEIIEAGFKGDKHYLSRTIAAVIILKNPSLLE